MNNKRSLAILGFCGMLLPLTISAAPARQQSSAGSQASLSNVDPIVAASRKARAEKAQQPNKAPKVYTNDDLSSIKGDGISIVGAPPETPKPDADASKTPAASPDQKGEAYWRAQFAEARRKLTDDQKEADILQREFNLKQQQYYSDPNQALREQNDRKDLDDTQAKIDAKKADVDKDQLAIETLQDDLRKAGGDPGWATDPNPETPPAQPASDAQPAQP